MEKILEEYKDFVYSKLNNGREDNNFLWLPESRHAFGSKNVKDSHLELARQRVFLQGVIGVVDELNEFIEAWESNKASARKEMLLEAGDILFYSCLIGISYPDLVLILSNFHYPPLSSIERGKIGSLLGLGKKIVFQEREELLPEFFVFLRDILHCVVRKVYLHYDYSSHIETLEIIMQKNMEKLNKRYKNGFSVEQSKNRE